MNDILDGNDVTYDSSSDEEPKIKRTKVRRKKSVVADQTNEKTSNKEMINIEDGDIPLVSITKGVIKHKEIEGHAKKEEKEKDGEMRDLKLRSSW